MLCCTQGFYMHAVPSFRNSRCYVECTRNPVDPKPLKCLLYSACYTILRFVIGGGTEYLPQNTSNWVEFLKMKILPSSLKARALWSHKNHSKPILYSWHLTLKNKHSCVLQTVCGSHTQTHTSILLPVVRMWKCITHLSSLWLSTTTT